MGSDDQIESASTLPAKNTEAVKTEVAECSATEPPRLWKPLLFVMLYQAAQEYYVSQWTEEHTPQFWSGVQYTKPAVATVVYLSALYFGKKFMANREPSPRLRKYIYTYNLYQVSLNAWCVYAFVKEVAKLYLYEGVGPIHLAVEQTSELTNFVIWLHYNNKFVELFDSVFMVLNKKNEQLSFLHVYHHVLLLWSWFAVCRYGGAGGVAWFSAMLNSMVHVLMYSYYLLAAMKIDCPWKKALTKAQMFQFVACMSTAIYSMRHNLYPFYLSCLNIFVMLNMLVLFGNFYRKRYAKSSDKDKANTTIKNTTTATDVAKQAIGVDAVADATKDAKQMQQDYSKHTESPRLWKPLLFVMLYQAAQEYYASQWTEEHTPQFWSGVQYTKPAVATVVYLSALYFGKKFMANREPSPRLRKYIYTYNLYQVSLNAWCVYAFVKEVAKLYLYEGVGPIHLAVEQTSELTNFVIWLHYNNKFVELFDSVFMVLNKKNEQLSFLHVYHHVLLLWSWFAVCRYGGAGGVAWFSAMLNSMVHVLMYSYYLLAAMKIDCPWKKALTKAQMFQFVACMSTAIYSMRHNLYPFYLSCLNIFVMLNMLVLFGNFYRKRYAKPSKAAALQSAATAKIKAQ